jgi:UDP-N-acetylglucosamine 2-epimerase (non-hydrolysing)
MQRVLVVFGTRPEAIKLAPVIKELRQYPADFMCQVCITGQHRQMLSQVLTLFQIEPDHDLSIMEERQSPSQIVASVSTQIESVLSAEQPDWVLVQGDTTTAMTVSLVAYHQRIKIGHVEAGLRTWDKFRPFPEEINRRVIDAVADLHFAPTEVARRNLAKEGLEPQTLLVTGNTAIDALLEIKTRRFDVQSSPLQGIPLDKRILLATAHRRENFGRPLESICRALLEIAHRYVDTVHLVYPVHLNPNVQETVRPLLDGVRNITLLPPMDYQSFVQLMSRSYLILTDSGGVQEEAPSLGVPVLVLRELTERPEVVEAGAAILVGTNTEDIVREATRLLEDRQAHRRMTQVVNPYGDGHASMRIVRALREYVGA